MPDDDVLLHRGRRFELRRRTVPTRGGGTTTREVVVHPGAVVLLPILDDGRVVLIRNQRFSVGETLWELPAGTRERGEAAERCAARELEEETGYRAGRLEPLLEFYASPGITDEKMRVFVATELTPAAQRLDPTEVIEVFPTAPEELRAMIQDGRVEDAKTIAAVLYWMTFG